MALASAIPTLPKHCKIPDSGQQALLQFVFVPLAVRILFYFIFCSRIYLVTGFTLTLLTALPFTLTNVLTTPYLNLALLILTLLPITFTIRLH